MRYDIHPIHDILLKYFQNKIYVYLSLSYAYSPPSINVRPISVNPL